MVRNPYKPPYVEVVEQDAASSTILSLTPGNTSHNRESVRNPKQPNPHPRRLRSVQRRFSMDAATITTTHITTPRLVPVGMSSSLATESEVPLTESAQPGSNVTLPPMDYSQRQRRGSTGTSSHDTQTESLFDFRVLVKDDDGLAHIQNKEFGKKNIKNNESTSTANKETIQRDADTKAVVKPTKESDDDDTNVTWAIRQTHPWVQRRASLGSGRAIQEAPNMTTGTKTPEATKSHEASTAYYSPRPHHLVRRGSTGRLSDTSAASHKAEFGTVGTADSSLSPMLVLHSCLKTSSKSASGMLVGYSSVHPPTKTVHWNMARNETHARLIPILGLEEYRTCWYSRPECQQMKADRAALAYHITRSYQRAASKHPQQKNRVSNKSPSSSLSRVDTEFS